MIEATTMISSLKDVLFSLGELSGALLVGVGLGVVSMLKKKNISLKWNTKRESASMQAHSKVHEALTELRVLIRASRSLVFQFHNGGKFSSGTSIKRFSITHESCSQGVLGMLLETQDVLLTRYMELVEILDTKPHKIIKVSDLADSSLRSILEINNVVYFSVSPLKCEDLLTPMGFVCCHWCDLSEMDELHAEGITETLIGDVVESSNRIINNHLVHAHK
jgi:hypothetical protein